MFKSTRNRRQSTINFRIFMYCLFKQPGREGVYNSISAECAPSVMQLYVSLVYSVQQGAPSELNVKRTFQTSPNTASKNSLRTGNTVLKWVTKLVVAVLIAATTNHVICQETP